MTDRGPLIPLRGLRRVRQVQRLPVWQLSRMSGIACRTILAYERGERRAYAHRARALADALGVNLGELVAPRWYEGRWIEREGTWDGEATNAG